VAAGGALGCFGCGAQQSRPVLVDERRGVLHGVRFGDSEGDVRARLGEPTDHAEGFFPQGADYTGPPSISVLKTDRRPPRRPTPLHYDDAAYLVSPTAGVFAMATLEDGARTLRRVAIGDALPTVNNRYGGATCNAAVRGEPLSGGKPPTYRWCRVRVGRIAVVFGGDPIESITLVRLP
jgi:hypothetical protein